MKGAKLLYSCIYRKVVDINLHSGKFGSVKKFQKSKLSGRRSQLMVSRLGPGGSGN